MPIQHSPPARQTKAQARAQSTEHPLWNEGRGPRRSNSFSGVVGRLPGLSRTIFKCPGEDAEEEEENYVEEEESDGTEGAPTPVGESQGTGGPTLAQSNQPVSHQSELSLLAIIHQINHIMANLQAASSSESSRPPAFKTPSIKAPECFDGTQPFKLRRFIQYCQLIFHNDPESLSQDRKKVLYATSFLIGRAEKCIETYLSNLPNQYPNYLLNSWQLLKSQLFTLFGDPNEAIKAEAELDSLRMKEVIDTPKGEDLILGFDFLNHFNPLLDWRQGLITFNSNHKDYYDSSKSFSNDFSSAKSCAALGGDSITPSFPSSVHIPSLNSHQSLLSSIDEVFKEIQDVGEDNSVSSLHLFFVNMDLPPSSYHDSLEKLWDEEEEPEELETIMKVVPSVDHQYLDVFSKLKAEKLPPHHACDHHIEVEGSLPPDVTGALRSEEGLALSKLGLTYGGLKDM
ncbi:hypothetical protein O181_050320, partial [Austropuccinia psidii MF-1]|nr:hypothetical protein [Austropuccinia psidii MF-1]